jgi:hypothetical protein
MTWSSVYTEVDIAEGIERIEQARALLVEKAEL